MLANLAFVVTRSKEGAPNATTNSALDPQPKAQVPIPQSKVAQGSYSSAAQDRLAQLRSKGLSDNEAAAIILSELKRSPVGVRHFSQEFWRNDWAQSVAAVDHQRALSSVEIAKSLIQLFGPDAPRLESLSEFLSPLGVRYSFLTFEEQAALLASGSELEGGPTGSPSVPNLPPTSSMPPQGMGAGWEQREVARLSKFLSPEKVVEVRLRSSTLASLMRSANADLQEKEFRALFTAIEAEGSNSSTFFDLYRTGTVTSTKLAKVLAKVDPTWTMLERIASARNIDQEKLVRSYDVSRSAVNRARRLLSTSNNGNQIGSVFEERNRQLGQIVPEEVATEMVNALRIPVTQGSNVPLAERIQF
jgi:hypothetical protein